jgi:hypothetical protein
MPVAGGLRVVFGFSRGTRRSQLKCECECELLARRSEKSKVRSEKEKSQFWVLSFELVLI